MKKLFLVILLTVVMVLATNAQIRKRGAIIGVVTDAEGAPLPGVTITVTGPALMGFQSTVTLEKGTYRTASVLPPGNYIVTSYCWGWHES